MIRIQAIYSRRFRKFGFERPATIPLLGPEPLRDAAPAGGVERSWAGKPAMPLYFLQSSKCVRVQLPQFAERTGLGRRPMHPHRAEPRGSAIGTGSSRARDG